MQEADQSNLWHYNRDLKALASRNRKGMTKAEACLWKYLLRGKRLMGYRFTRQRPVGNYITDFLCKELMVVIEVDGLTHQFDEVAENDVIRERALKAMGFTVLRFNDEMVLRDLASVERTLIDYIERHTGC